MMHKGYLAPVRERLIFAKDIPIYQGCIMHSR